MEGRLHDAHGRFAAGNPGGPGRKQDPETLELKKWLQQWFNSAEGRAIIEQRLRDSDRMLIHALDRAFGKVRDTAEIHVRSFEDFSDEELRRIIESSETMDTGSGQNTTTHDDTH